MHSPKTKRQASRDAITVLCGAFMTIVAKVFEIEDVEFQGAILTVLVIMCHRGVPH